MQQTDTDAQRALSIAPQGVFIGGKSQAAASGRTLDVTSPIDGRKLTTIAEGGAAVRF